MTSYTPTSPHPRTLRRALRRAGLVTVLVGSLALPLGAAGGAPLPGGKDQPPTAPLRAATGWSAHDLGVLPGHASSEGADIDDGIVVGTSYDAYLASRAFAYDVGSGRLRDLGTLGGESSGATGVDGGTVVGWADTADGERHAFAYDLQTSVMRDLGRHDEGWWSEAAAVDGDLVVGSANGGGYSSRPFVFDLATGRMTMLPLLPGGTFGEGHGVDGDVIVGWSNTATEGQHAFALDLGSNELTSLGTLGGGDASWAYDVDGDTVVGSSLTRIGPEAYAYDLGVGVMRGLGVLPLGTGSTAYAVDSGVVVGRANVYTDQDSFYWHAVVRPIGGGAWSLLPEPAGSWSSEAFGVDTSGGSPQVVGTVSTRAGTRAVLWEPVPAVAGTRPVVRGTARVGRTLAVQRGAWSPAGVVLSQQWRRDGRAIRGATGLTYRVVRADRGHRLSVAVTGRKPGYAPATVTSASTAVVR